MGGCSGIARDGEKGLPVSKNQGHTDGFSKICDQAK